MHVCGTNTPVLYGTGARRASATFCSTSLALRKHRCSCRPHAISDATITCSCEQLRACSYRSLFTMPKRPCHTLDEGDRDAPTEGTRTRVRNTLPMRSRTFRTSQPITIRRAVARDAKRLTRIVRGSSAYQGEYAGAVAGYRVGPDYIEAHRVFVAVSTDEDGEAGSSGSTRSSLFRRSSTCCSSLTRRRGGVLEGGSSST